MDVSVHDRHGVFVTGLSERDFSVREDGVPQTLDLARPVSRPATYTVLVDTSQSMSRRMDMVRHAASLLVGYLRPDDRIVLAPFSKTLGAVTGPTTDRQTVLQTIDAFRSSGGTAILDAVYAAGRTLAVDETRHAIVLLTDGFDEHSTTERDVALQRVRQLHATLYVIGIPGSAGISLKGETFLRDLANATGGRAFFPVRERELTWVEQRLTEEVQHQYIVSYTPLNQRVDGTWRTIALETSNSEWKVRTRRGYLAPAPPPIRPSIEFTLMNAEAELLEVSAENLTVREDGVEQQIDVFQESVDPVSIVLALDSSGSMKIAAEGARAAAGAFVAAVRPEDRLSLVTFADSVEFAHDLTKERSWSLQAIQQYVARGGTALYDALVESLVRLKKEKGRRVVVVVTDGRDENNPVPGPEAFARGMTCCRACRKVKPPCSLSDWGHGSIARCCTNSRSSPGARRTSRWTWQSSRLTTDASSKIFGAVTSSVTPRRTRCGTEPGERSGSTAGCPARSRGARAGTSPLRTEINGIDGGAGDPPWITKVTEMAELQPELQDGQAPKAETI